MDSPIQCTSGEPGRLHNRSLVLRLLRAGQGGRRASSRPDTQRLARPALASAARARFLGALPHAPAHVLLLRKEQRGAKGVGAAVGLCEASGGARVRELHSCGMLSGDSLLGQPRFLVAARSSTPCASSPRRRRGDDSAFVGFFFARSRAEDWSAGTGRASSKHGRLSEIFVVVR